LENQNILLIEDDDNVAVTIERCLRREDFRVSLASSGVQGLQLARRRVPDLVLLDVIMPGMDGYAVCGEMRADPLLTKVPIIFLTAKNRDEDRIKGFLAGGDDYINKPFNLDELILRVRAVLRRTNSQQVEVKDKSQSSNSKREQMLSGQMDNGHNLIEIKKYCLNIKTFELTLPNKKKVLLTPIQFDLLFHFMSHPGEIFSPGRLLDEIWDYPSDAGSPDLVRVHIKNLRMRIEPDPVAPVFIETIPGYGYTVRVNTSEENNG
jgi:two-component system, OmpR family, response regulator RpaA